MAHEFTDRQELFLCSCGSTEHQIVFQLFDWGKDPDGNELSPIAVENLDCAMNVFLNDLSLWKRIKMAVKYVLGYKCRYGHWDHFIVDFETAGRLIEGMERYRTLYRSYQRRKPSRS